MLHNIDHTKEARDTQKTQNVADITDRDKMWTEIDTIDIAMDIITVTTFRAALISLEHRSDWSIKRYKIVHRINDR